MKENSGDCVLRLRSKGTHFASLKILPSDVKMYSKPFELFHKTEASRLISAATSQTYSDSTSATVHLYCAVENKQMSANCRTETLIFLTVLLELFAICTLTAMDSP